MSNSDHKLPFALRGDLAGEMGFHEPARCLRKDGTPYPDSKRFAFFYSMSGDGKERHRWILDGFRYMLVDDKSAGAGVLVFDEFFESFTAVNPNVPWHACVCQRKKEAPYFHGGNALLHAPVSGMVLLSTVQVAQDWCRRSPPPKF
ncbi:MAG: hypothetical protein Q8J74_02770 [Candidatus Didemnitutus sp.]|nr:hypothetical protein [Candidatus Didemnitutus sp.]